jgi:predicted acylesterase/phospholipase RssA/FMN phosphatase YigB (HAD superfamily)
MTEPQTRWIIFDADNTLWQAETLYNQARQRLCSYVAEHCEASKEEIERFQRSTDKSLEPVYGYSAARFARSFEDTYKNFVPAPEADALRHVRKLAEDVFANKAEPFDGVELVLRSLHQAGFKLGLITAGEEWVQRKRLGEFHLEGIFHAVAIVERKSAETFKNFCSVYKAELDHTVVVGDSLRSDIEPAKKAGLKAILVKHPNWAEVENRDSSTKPDLVLEGINDLLAALEVSEIDLRPVAEDGLEAFGIFEGGGAKGLAHIGALKAAEERKVRFSGVAGTSAGSIIAGLIAVGYTADELFATSGAVRPFNGDYLSHLGSEKWLGPEKWEYGKRIIEDARNLVGRLGRPLPGTRRGRTWRLAVDLFDWQRLGGVLRRSHSEISAASQSLGYFTTASFAEWYNQLLLEKVPERGQKWVRFSDVSFNLKIVSADVSHAEIVIHSRETCPDRPIAEAVAASISIPIFFQPYRISDHELHVDGGILSNFPAWLFIEESIAARGAPIIGFQLMDITRDETTEQDPLAFMGALLATAISGKKRLEVRGVESLYPIPIPVTATTFQFDMTKDQKLQTYREGYNAVRKFFPGALQLVTQAQMAPYLFEAQKVLTEAIGRHVHLRVNIMDRTPLGQVAVRYRYNMDFDTDDELKFPLDAGGVGRAYRQREPEIVDLERAKRDYPTYNMSKYHQALVRQSLNSLLCVPLFDPRGGQMDIGAREMIGVLNFDSDDNLLDDFARTVDRAMEIAVYIAHIWVQIAQSGTISEGTQDERPRSDPAH